MANAYSTWLGHETLLLRVTLRLVGPDDPATFDCRRQRAPRSRTIGAIRSGGAFVDCALVVADTAGLILYWNECATALFGYTAAHAVGRPVDLLVPDDFEDRHWEGFNRVMSGGERHLEGAVINLPVRISDGRVLAFPARFVHLDDPFGRPVGAMAIFAPRRGDPQPWTSVETS